MNTYYVNKLWFSHFLPPPTSSICSASFNDKQVFAWHQYCPLSIKNSTLFECDQLFATASFSKHIKDGRSQGGGTFLTEFGAVYKQNPAGEEEIQYLADLADEYGESYCYWDYHGLAGNPKLWSILTRYGEYLFIYKYDEMSIIYK